MDYTNLSDLFKGICDAIRAKKGTTGVIKHQDIPSEIESIETGADVSGGVGYIGNAITTTRSSRIAIYFPLSEGTDNIIGFNVMAIEQVDSNTSYDYITAIFNYGGNSMVHYISGDAQVFYEETADGGSLSWAIIDGLLQIIVEHDASGFRGGINYRCYPIYSKGGIDVSVDIEVT